MTLLLSYLLLINAAAFCFMLADKIKAKRGSWRIPEATLFGLAALGGSFGSLLAMKCFRHKTKHLKFSLGLPLLLGCHILSFIALISFLFQ